MASLARVHGVTISLIASGVLWAAAFGAARLGAATPQAASGRTSPPSSQAPSPPAPAVTQGDTYIGETACIECHEAQRKGLFESPHHRSTDPRSPAGQKGCETCHGPGGKHQDDPVLNPIRDFKTLTPKEVTAVCATCHNRGDHALWAGSQHETRGVTCTTCHAVHAYQSETGQLKARTQTALCATCHRDKAAKLDRSGHMPLREGKMQCTTCHNVHGATNVRLLRTGDSVAELCTSCHADKRGPFLWEHPPARDGCITCHDPHGSSNERMLIVKTPMLCQRCHVSTRHPSTIYDAALINTSVRVYARSCVTCHAAIHGSNHASGQRFIR